MCVCVYTGVSVCLYTHTNTQTRTHVYTHTRAHTDTHTHTHTHIHTHSTAPTHTHTHTHTHTQWYIGPHRVGDGLGPTANCLEVRRQDTPGQRRGERERCERETETGGAGTKGEKRETDKERRAKDVGSGGWGGEVKIWSLRLGPYS